MQGRTAAEGLPACGDGWTTQLVRFGQASITSRSMEGTASRRDVFGPVTPGLFLQGCSNSPASSLGASAAMESLTGRAALCFQGRLFSPLLREGASLLLGFTSWVRLAETTSRTQALDATKRIAKTSSLPSSFLPSPTPSVLFQNKAPLSRSALPTFASHQEVQSRRDTSTTTPLTMLAFQRAGQAIKACSSTATLRRALTATPTIQVQQRAIHDDATEVTKADKQARPAIGPVEGSDSVSTSKAADTVAAAVNVVGKTADLGGDEFWRKVPIWKDVSVESFMSYRWSVGRESP